MRTSTILLLTLAACERSAPTTDAQASPAKAAALSSATPRQPIGFAESPTIRLLEIAGDMRLSDAERARLADLERRARVADADAAAKDDAGIRTLLVQHAKANAIGRAQIRHKVRVELHFGRAKLSDPLPIALLDRHDPVLVEDRARRELVTLADIRALDASNRFIARIAGIQVPALTEAPGERAELQRRYRADASLRTALTYAGPRHAMMVAAMDGLPSAKRAEIDRIIREQVRSPEDAANAARGVEHAVILAQQRKAQQARNSAALADFKRWIHQRNQVTLGMARLDGVMKVLNTENTYFPR